VSLLDRFDAPCTRHDTSDYRIDMAIMDGPYGDAASHANRPVTDACESVARQLRAIDDTLDLTIVAIVRRTSESECEPIPGIDPMTYPQALAELAEISRVAPDRLDEFDLVYAYPDGTLGRYASHGMSATVAGQDVPVHMGGHV
jgi:hypothetical protein